MAKKKAAPAVSVEDELIRADIAFLKQKRIEDGSWEKWKRSQRQLGITFPEDAEIKLVKVEVKAPRSNRITSSMFLTATGHLPVRDDLVRCNCTKAGLVGHWSCGWCATCDKPVFICGHRINRGRS